MSLANLTKLLDQTDDSLVHVFSELKDFNNKFDSYILLKKEQAVFDTKRFEFDHEQLAVSKEMVEAFRESRGSTGSGDDLEAKRDQKDFNERLLKAIKNQSGGKSVTKNYKGDSFGSKIGDALSGGISIAGKGMGAAIALGSLGLGIGAFFSGLSAGDKIGAMFKTDFSHTKKGMVTLAEAFSEAPGDGLLILGGIMAGGAFKNIGIDGALGMTAMGAGIGGFFAGLALGDKAGAMLGVDGSNLKSQMINLAEGISAFDNKTLAILGVMMGIGAVLGPKKAFIAAAGMTAMGVGIGGFFGGLTGVGDILAKLGVDGSGIKEMMSNVAGGLKEFNGIDPAALAGIAGAAALLGPAMLILLGSDGLSSIGDAVLGWFGIGKEDDDIFSKVAKGLKKLEVVDASKLNGLVEVGNSVKNLSSGLKTIQNMDLGIVRDQLQEMGEMLAWAAPMFKEIDYSGMDKAGEMGTGIFETVQQNHDALMATRPNKGQTLTEQTKVMEDNINKPTPVVVSAPTQNTSNVNNNTSAVIADGSLSMTDSFDMGTRDW